MIRYAGFRPAQPIDVEGALVTTVQRKRLFLNRHIEALPPYNAGMNRALTREQNARFSKAL